MLFLPASPIGSEYLSLQAFSDNTGINRKPMKTDRPTIEKLFRDFEGKHVLILGDVMIDAYLRGKVERISPEAPVPVVQLNKRENLLGGAANVALNIRALGAVPVLCSVIGEDQRGKEFMQLLKDDGISGEGILQSDSRITTTKFRIIGNKVQMLRVDEEMDTDLNDREAERLLDKIRELMQRLPVSVVIFQDYDKGVLTRSLIEDVIQLANSKGVPVVVDPKKKHFDAYRGVDLFKPNLKELREGLKIDIDSGDIESIRSAVSHLQESQSIRSVMVTLSEAGVYLNEKADGKTNEVLVPAHLRNIADVSGAGDTVISVASLCRALGASSWLTAALSNLAGGLVCEFVGVVPVNRQRLMTEALELLTDSGLKTG